MRSKFFFWTFLLLFSSGLSESVNSQNAENIVKNYKPQSPSSFEYQKYLDVPVSLFTGLASVSVPLYNLTVDGFTIPIQLNYHSGGIRVSQEASWVGLGWDMNFGNITQEVNDKDDYGTGVVFRRPDWNESPVPSNYYSKYINMWHGVLAPGWDDQDPILSPKALHSYRIYSAYPESIGAPGPTYFDAIVHLFYYIPVNGNRDQQPDNTYMVTDNNYDSELDIFTANFLGRSLKFIRNPNNNSFVILNAKGYKVDKTGNYFYITDPTGVQYHFELNYTNSAYSITYGGVGNVGFSSTPTETSSREWLLTKVVTRNKREIVLNYSQSITEYDQYPSYSEKYIHVLSANSQTITTSGEYIGFPYQVSSGISKTAIYSKSKKTYLSSISFPGGSVDFTLNDRDDQLGGKKAELIEVKYGSSVIYSFDLDYGYFDASSVTSNGFTPDNASVYGNTYKKRLKLLSVTNSSNEKYTFMYDETNLPAKNSFAQDYWGYANGATSNVSLIPNPTRLSSAQLNGATGLADNGNNHSARLDYARAGTLTSIRYPTGGKTLFEYELNQFDSYWAQDYSSASNTVTSGNGLRVKSISFFSAENILAKKSVFEYGVGKAMSRIDFTRQYGFNSLNLGSIPSQTSNSILELNGKGFFPANSLGSGNGIGYPSVKRKEVDAQGNDNGRIEFDYKIQPDVVSKGATFAYLNAFLPSRKAINNSTTGTYTNMPENGSLLEERVYNKANQIIRKSEYTYETDLSDIHYGARLFTYSLVYAYAGNGSQQTWRGVPTVLVGYYPIYDLNSRQKTQTITEYDQNAVGITTSVTFYYDALGQLIEELKSTSNSLLQTIYTHAYENLWIPVNNSLFTQNRLSDLMKVTQYRRDLNYGNSRLLRTDDYSFTATGNLILNNRITRTIASSMFTSPQTVQYISFDEFGNPTEMLDDSKRTSMLWDHQGQFVTAIVENASYNDIAYTSFEGTNTGNWTYPAITYDDPTAITGKRVLILESGQSVTRSGLNSSRQYNLSYWTKNSSAFSITGTVAGYPRLLKTIGPWRLFEHIVANQTTVTISGTGLIDEVRLYPSSAMMASISYDPLIGIITECDPNNRISYYEYYNDRRLKLIRDQDQNILKMFCYNLFNEPEDCGVLLYKNTEKSGVFTRNNCPTGYTGGSYNYIVGQGTHTSSVSQQAADDLATLDVTNNGQAAANLYGSCTPVLYAIRGTNTTSAAYTFTFTNTVTSEVTTVSLPSGSTNQTVANLPIGTYNITASSSSSAVTYLDFGGIISSAASHSLTAVSISANTTFTIQPSAPGPCSFSMSSGYFSPTNGLSSNGNAASGYLVFYSGSVMTQGNFYHVATISSPCRPSVIRSLTTNAAGRNWNIFIHPDGKMYWQLANGSADVSANTTITISSLSYNL